MNPQSSEQGQDGLQIRRATRHPLRQTAWLCTHTDVVVGLHHSHKGNSVYLCCISKVLSFGVGVCWGAVGGDPPTLSGGPALTHPHPTDSVSWLALDMTGGSVWEILCLIPRPPALTSRLSFHHIKPQFLLHDIPAYQMTSGAEK